MNNFIRVLLLLALALPSIAHAGTQRALLIGVSNYAGNLPPLPGSRNDISLMNQILIAQYGFDPKNIQVLLDEQATRQGILDSVYQLSQQAAEDDIVYIHFSGHGSQAPDQNGDEADGADETIVPYDARTEGIPDITDDEINGLMSEFRSRSLVIVLDSCHSGTGTRGGPAQVTQRWVPADTRANLYRQIKTRGAVNLPVSENHVLFAAAQDFESELDGPFGPDMMRLGLFTAAMAGVLVNSPPSITPRQLIEGVNELVEGLKASAGGMPVPEPNLEAPLEKYDEPLFVADRTPEGLAPSFSDDAPEFPPVRSIHVTWKGNPEVALARKLAPLVGTNVSVAHSIAAADAVIDVLSLDAYDVYGPAGFVQVAKGLTKNRALSAGMTSAKTGELDFLAEVVRMAPTLADLVSLASPNSAIQLRIQPAGVPITRQQPLSTRSIRVTANTRDHKLRFYVPGEQRSRENSLQLEVSSSKDCYLTIFSVNSNGQAFLLLPNVAQESSGFLPDGLIKAGLPLLVPDSLDDDNIAGFHFDYAPPGGVDRLIGVCFQQLGDAELFRTQLARLDAGNSMDAEVFGSGTRGLTNITPGDSNTAPQSAKQTYPETQSSAAPTWAASQLSLEVGNR